MAEIVSVFPDPQPVFPDPQPAHVDSAAFSMKTGLPDTGRAGDAAVPDNSICMAAQKQQQT